MDVPSLYTNIDNNSGSEAVKQAFLRNPNFDRPDVDILELLKISLEHNDTQVARHFNGAGHSYANLRITILESGPFSDDTSLETIYRRKATYKLLQSAYPDIYTPRFITAFSKNKNLKDMLVSTKLQ